MTTRVYHRSGRFEGGDRMTTSIYTALRDFATDPTTGEGWEAALAKAESWRDTLQEMVEVASPCQKLWITDLLGSLGLFFEEYVKWKQAQPEPPEPEFRLLNEYEPFEAGDEASEILGKNAIWFPIVDSIGNCLHDRLRWKQARRRTN